MLIKVQMSLGAHIDASQVHPECMTRFGPQAEPRQTAGRCCAEQDGMHVAAGPPGH